MTPLVSLTVLMFPAFKSPVPPDTEHPQPVGRCTCLRLRPQVQRRAQLCSQTFGESGDAALGQEH